MALRNYIFTSESVSEGHPDKVCDRISDTVVDAFSGADPEARVPRDPGHHQPHRAGRRSARARSVTHELIDAAARARRSRTSATSRRASTGRRPSRLLHAQSADIAQGVDAADNKDEGAGDQGIMFGYACRETPELMPAPMYYAHEHPASAGGSPPLAATPVLEPDAKSQVSLRYEDGKPVAATLDRRLHPALTRPDHRHVREIVPPHVDDVSAGGPAARKTEFHVNPTGRFVIGGPDGDAGLTGRKIIVDTYGGAAPHGGGAFSGKDPTKVDRSAAYAARYLAKNVVAAELAERCTIQFAYAIGVSQPLAVYVDTYGTGEVDENRLSRRCRS